MCTILIPSTPQDSDICKPNDKPRGVECWLSSRRLRPITFLLRSSINMQDSSHLSRMGPRVPSSRTLVAHSDLVSADLSVSLSTHDSNLHPSYCLSLNVLRNSPIRHFLAAEAYMKCRASKPTFRTALKVIKDRQASKSMIGLILTSSKVLGRGRDDNFT